MTFVLLFIGILLAGVLLAVIGGVLLFMRKSKLAGGIILSVGLLAVVVSVLAFLSLVITSSSMG